MEVIGRVSGGVVILKDTDVLPDGTLVRVEPVEDAKAERDGPTLAEKLCRLAGKAKGLPPDLARNHDHYLYGLPKK